jgi:hypothetical protein
MNQHVHQDKSFMNESMNRHACPYFENKGQPRLVAAKKHPNKIQFLREKLSDFNNVLARTPRVLSSQGVKGIGLPGTHT